MKVTPTDILDVLVLEPRRFEDARGFFSEVWNSSTLADAGIAEDFVQDNQSLSRVAGTVRGLHYQAPPHAQVKLVRCGRGRIWDVAVDVRAGSPTFGKWIGVELSAENGRQLFIPVGFLHGFSTMTNDAEVLYKCTSHYAPEADGAVRFDSAALGIDWKLGGREPLLSDKDMTAPEFDAWQTPFEWRDA